MRETLAATRVEGCCLGSLGAEFEGALRESLSVDGLLETGIREDVGAKDSPLLDDDRSLETILV